MNIKMSVKRVIGLSLLSGMFIPVLASAESYTVKSGDTLSAIAKEKNATVDAIAKKNKISNVNLITVGQVLEIEDEKATTNTTEQAATSKANTTQATTTVSASDGQYYGRYQLSLSYLNGDLSEANQEKVANQYVVNRYGSWSAAKNFWLANGWY